jgi:hypothetical protein
MSKTYLKSDHFVGGGSPSSSQWLHEIKHDGFRVIARKQPSWQ